MTTIWGLLVGTSPISTDCVGEAAIAGLPPIEIVNLEGCFES